MTPGPPPADGEALLQSVFDSLPALVVVLDGRGMITRASRAWNLAARAAGASPEAVGVGRDYLEVCRQAAPSSAYARRALDGIAEVLRGAADGFEMEYACAAPGGPVFWALMQVAPLPPSVGGVVVSHLDITARRRAEERAAEQGRKYRGIFEAAEVAIWECDFSEVRAMLDALRAEGAGDLAAYVRGRPEWAAQAMRRVRVRAVNPCAVKLMEARDAAELLHAPLEGPLPESPAYFAEQLAAMVEGRRTFEAETRIVTRRGATRYVIATVAFPADGDPFDSVLFTALDVTARRRAEERAAAQTRKYREMFEDAGVAMWECDFSGVRALVDAWRAEGVADLRAHLAQRPDRLRQAAAAVRVLDVNRRAVRLLEAPGKEDLLAPPVDGLTAEARAELAEQVAALAEGRGEVEAEATLRTRTGAVRSILAVTAFPREGDSRSTVLKSAVDVTERRRAEEALRQSEARFRMVADAAPVLIWMAGTDGRLSFANRPWEEFTGVAEGASLHEAWADALHPAEAEAVQRGWRAAFEARGPCRTEYRLRRADGEFRWILSTGVPVRSPEGEFQGYVGSAIDITERRWAEEALRASEEALRLSNGAIRAMAGRLIESAEQERRHVARELHDDLGQRIARLGLGVSALRRAAGAAGEEAGAALQAQVAELAEALRGLSHRMHPAVLEHAGLLPALREYCEEMGREGLRVYVRAPPQLPSMAPEAALCVYRVAQEALRNVQRHAGASGAFLTLDATADTLRLSVRDMGRGFDPAAARRRGGLGLVSMAERARLAEGAVEVRSTPRRGTEVRLEVPVARRASAKLRS